MFFTQLYTLTVCSESVTECLLSLPEVSPWAGINSEQTTGLDSLSPVVLVCGRRRKEEQNFIAMFGYLV